jgi:quercetin dioxygenase-like cupin family protein
MPTAPVRRHDARRTETPSAAMTTFASPSLGPSVGLSLWQVEMRHGQRGPLHVFDSEQLWMVAAGEVTILVGGDTCVLEQGDTLVRPGGVERRIGAVSDARMIVCGHGNAVASVPGEACSRGTPQWIG